MKIKKTIIILSIILPLISYGQDTTFFDINDKKVNSLELSDYYNVTTADSIFIDRKMEITFSRMGTLKSEKHLIEVKNDKDGKLILKKDGKYKEWYNNGKIHCDIDYKNGKFDGLILTYWENGKLKREEDFLDGKSIGGICFDSLGNKLDYSPYEIMPIFPGGERALLNYISKKLEYPFEMQRQGIQGKVIIRFVIDKDGRATNIDIIKGSRNEFNQEAIRIIKSLPQWKPGIQDGEIVKVYYTLPINFSLH